MTSQETKELARDKVHSIYIGKTFKTNAKDTYWSVSDESQKACIESDKRDLEAWSYILSLIEKDNKL